MSMRGNEGAPPARPEGDSGGGGTPWGRIIAVIVGLLLLAILIPLACQAFTGGSGGGDEGAAGDQETTGSTQASEQGAGAGGSGADTTGSTSASTAGVGAPAGGGSTGAEQRASGDGETTAAEVAGGAGGEQAGAAPGDAVTAGFGGAAGGAGGAVGQVGGQAQGEGSMLDQTADGTAVVIPQATISGTGGWVAVYRDEGGQPGAVIGAAALQEGTNPQVVVPLEEPISDSQQLYAMIHADDPTDDAFTFPDGDPPVEKDGEPVAEAFQYTVGTLAAGEPIMPDTGGLALLPLLGGLMLIGGLLLVRHVREASG